MASQKGSEKGIDQTKKRKWESNDADAKSKRHRKGDQVKSGGAGAGRADPKSATQNDVNGSSGAVVSKRPAGQQRLDMINQTKSETGWSVSKPMGGRMLDVDPILTEDEQYLILAYNTSVQVYSAADSLLVRRIPISTLDSLAPKNTKPATIVAMRLSKQAPQYVWVACSDGRVFHVDWTLASNPSASFQTQSKTADAMTLLQMGTAEKKQEVVAVLEWVGYERSEQVVVYVSGEGEVPQSKTLLSLPRYGQAGLPLIESSDDGQVIVGALNDQLFLGTAAGGAVEVLDQMRYDFFSFELPDIITCLDLKTSTKKAVAGSKKNKAGHAQKVDVIVGGARGGIYLYQDAIARLQELEKSKSDKDSIQAQKYHWHRKAVHSLKWSRDGNYMISGGSENVLVMWQIDTSKKDFLPHLSGAVDNITVSASGSSYVVHLDDNSAMVLSTAEMKPIAYVSGIQSAAVNLTIPKDMLVSRVWKAPHHVQRPIPAAIRPSEPSKLHVCVGNGRQSTMTGDFSAPLLQTFDLETFTSVTKQPLARTHPTDVNMSNKGYQIDEPLVTCVSFSADGKWLASVDDWKPSERDVDNVTGNLRGQFIRERHEVHLKFWEVGSGDQPAALVSRINAPHATTHPEDVLDLAAGPTSACFATIGGDGMVRIWRPKLRKSGGIVSKGADGRELYSWSCTQMIPVGDGLSQESAVDLVSSSRASPVHGSVAFSEDGSTIFAAFGGVDAGAVYVIDTTSGEVVKTLQGMWTGRLQSLEVLSPFVIVLSGELRVYDVVSDELRYGIQIPSIHGVSELLQLEVDRKSGHFAVALPIGDFSSVGVFDPEEPEPLLVRSVPHRVVSLVTAPDTSGFVALDDSAQIWTIGEESDPLSLAAIQPLEDLRLDAPTAAAGKSAAVLLGDDDDASDDDDGEEAAGAPAQMDEDVDVDMDDGTHTSVVAAQHLANIFDAAPAFAGPSVEDMFYRVANLLGAKPLVAVSE